MPWCRVRIKKGGDPFRGKGLRGRLVGGVEHEELPHEVNSVGRGAGEQIRRKAAYPKGTEP